VVKALVYAVWGVVEVKDVPDPKLLPGELLIRVQACGICGSELEAFSFKKPRRTPPLILGHEFCGVIDTVGKGANGLQEGQRVVGSSVISCGHCHACLRGDRHLCANRQVPGMNRPGGMAELVAMPADHVFPCPDTLDPVTGALTEPLANGIHMMNMAPGGRGLSVAIIGAGTIGLMTLQAAQYLREARVVVSDLDEARLAVALDLGAEEVINPAKRDVVAACVEFSGADGVDLCVDAVGTRETKNQSVQMLRAGGSCFWIGLYHDEISLKSYDVTVPEKKVFGTYAGKREEFLQAIGALAEKKAVGGPWIKTFSLEDGVAAFHHALIPEEGYIKTTIIPG
jgi:threonine dehydrogenase-like Zn-dependent dehydrogenase